MITHGSFTLVLGYGTFCGCFAFHFAVIVIGCVVLTLLESNTTNQGCTNDDVCIMSHAAPSFSQGCSGDPLFDFRPPGPEKRVEVEESERHRHGGV